MKKACLQHTPILGDRGVLAAAAALMLVACSSTEADTLDGEGSGLDTPYETSAGGSSGQSASDGDSDDADPGGTSGGDGAPEPGDGSTGGDPMPGADEGADMSPCPESLPEGWVFCEDFEDLVDPGKVFFEYQSDGGAFSLVDDAGASGTHSMRASYYPGREGAGWLSIAFGANPVVGLDRPMYAEADHFDEIYWRMRIRMQKGWPDVGPGKLTRLTSVADENWAQSMVARLWSAGGDVTLAGDALSCVVGSEVACTGFGDQSLQPLGLLQGETPLFSSKYSATWHCVEGHVKLNTPGQTDGVFEFWVDDLLEDGRHDLDWRGSWDQFGINLITVENFWSGGAPEHLDRWIDDIVIATEPIGCE